jgi:hypothetical protein
VGEAVTRRHGLPGRAGRRRWRGEAIARQRWLRWRRLRRWLLQGAARHGAAQGRRPRRRQGRRPQAAGRRRGGEGKQTSMPLNFGGLADVAMKA